MKIAWVTPTNDKSAIFEYSKIIINELVKYAKVAIFGTAEKVDKLKGDYYSLYEESNIEKLNEFDLIIYNMGDNYNYHGKIFETYLKFPGVVILHDLYFKNLMNGHFAKFKNGDELKKETIAHSENFSENKVDLKIAFNFFGDDSYSDGSMQPMFEPILSNALGVITHCEEANDIVSKIYPYSCTTIGLPYTINSSTNNKKIESNKIEVTTIGYVNKEKRHDIVIQAINSNDQLKNKIHYNIAGPYDEKSDYYKYLVSIINKFNLNNNVTFYGEISNEQMGDMFSKTDIFINLRKPCLNTGSWSLIEELASGKAVISENFGFARSIPDQVVTKLKSNKQIGEIKSLAKIIQKLSSSKENREEYGKIGIKHIKENNSPENYCKKLMLFAKSIVQNRSLKYQQEMSSTSATYESLVFTNSGTFNSFFNFSGIIKK